MSATPIPIRPDNFKGIHLRIQEMVQRLGISYIDACIDYCDKNGLEVELLGDIIASDPSLRAKIEIEAAQLHMLKAKE